MSAVIEVKDIIVDYITESGHARAVDNVSFSIKKGEILGLAGESGCGKSTIAMAIPQLHQPPAVISGGEVWMSGKDVLKLDETGLNSLRWNTISLVFQSAMNALNPVVSVYKQFEDVLLEHKAVNNKKEAETRTRELFSLVDIHSDRIYDYPHQFSGGMRQRIAIAMAMALNPDLIIMDEPTTALDVVVQRQILKKIKQLQADIGFSILFITHDLSLMVELCDRIGIMYAGRIVEMSPAKTILESPRHPYTLGLKESFPTLHRSTNELHSIKGTPPNLLDLPDGCAFAPRCRFATISCQQTQPTMVSKENGQHVACFNPIEITNSKEVVA
ncbi:ABC transporter ATP-binding protein [Vibrio sp. DW001]|uniref:ABC transporter ATP-binding protein n=1 Tax=Vibrio sp. DW001 TaxID=2912315 RepID=UPI0023AF2C35|nr:ABC transporter ATP-binding protein [Vibrio sp. DW001]WED27835.1 ABC transporter ATP-binding protein [Vibrio sp. DW001]